MSSPRAPNTSTLLDTPACASIPRRTSPEGGKVQKPTIKNPSQIITLFAGGSPERFVVHKDFACYHSPVLKAAFNSNFIEGQTQEYRLQEANGPVVLVLVNWFYTQELDVTALGKVNTKTNFNSLAQLWILAGKLLIPRLQNETIRKFLRLKEKEKLVPTSCFHTVYEGTGPGSPLRSLCVAMCVNYLSSLAYKLHDGAEFPKEMLLDLVTLMGESFPTSERFALYEQTNGCVALMDKDFKYELNWWRNMTVGMNMDELL